jgi:hypothetical protein
MYTGVGGGLYTGVGGGLYTGVVAVSTPALEADSTPAPVRTHIEATFHRGLFSSKNWKSGVCEILQNY